MKKNPIVKVFDYFIDTVTELFVSLFDGLLRGVDHATPSTFALDATLLPWVLPAPIAFMTAHSLETYFRWDVWASYVMGFGLEGLGVLVWARLATAVVEGNRGKWAMVMLGGVAAVYETILVWLNVVIASQHGTESSMVVVLFLVCLLPALSAILLGFHKHDVLRKFAIEASERKAREEQERREAAELAERIRQEKREDRKEAAELRLKYAADTKQEGLREDKPFRGKRTDRK